MIEVKNLSKSFGDKGVLSDINFSIPKGQAVTIIGKSGVGKSVLLKCLIGLLKPDLGTVYIDNKLINCPQTLISNYKPKIWNIRRLSIGIIG